MITVLSIEEDVDLRPDASGRRFVLLDPLFTEVEVDGVHNVITVPMGFNTDLASVPRALWGWIPPHGRYLRAAVVHDYLYYVSDRPRKEADEIFHALMVHMGVSKLRAGLMYYAVRIFGRGRGSW